MIQDGKNKKAGPGGDLEPANRLNGAWTLRPPRLSCQDPTGRSRRDRMSEQRRRVVQQVPQFLTVLGRQIHRCQKDLLKVLQFAIRLNAESQAFGWSATAVVPPFLFKPLVVTDHIAELHG